MSAISIHNLKKTYSNGTHALKGINLEIAEGDFFALLGANGAGKTTAIGILTGLVNKTSGTVSIHGQDLDQHLDKAKEFIGVVPQEFNFSIFEKVIDIVTQQAGYFGIPHHEALKEAEVILKALDLWEKRNTIGRSLSGGMKRRLMIARGLIHKPRVLILDEPTAGVDVELRHGMWKYLKKLNQEGTTILMTTHYLEEVEQLCKNVAIIKQGEIVKNDSVKNLLASVEKKSYVINVNTMKNHDKILGYDLKMIDDTTLETDLGMDQSLTELVNSLAQHGIIIKDIRPKGNRIEQLFLNILKN